MLFHIFIGIPIQEQVTKLVPPLEIISYCGKKFLGLYSQHAESFCIKEMSELLNTTLQKLNEVTFKDIQTYQATPIIIPEILIG
ncbi:hypothetical protein [Chlamydia sp.]|uniref:hypothetical protein n=1 Tax=Chlamydia sp. TaxID=35827 RepID=UPI0025BFFCDD|nr:hypothetical protein [Chlamydia sp.]MBQ8498610.1 hypothetical protein [Chlamydia sp.]